tara:strand:- start:6585 stop:7931 length:1347 start_codon:yes stop_codon:yes gene_type:complete
MFYKFLEILLKISVRIYFKNKVITGKENIPIGKPVLFVANHPGAFLDPIVIGSYAGRSSYYLARGESFRNSFSAWFFKKIHMIPVYRKEETPELIHKNEAVFGACYEHFENGGSLVIFPEGTSKIEYRLRKVKSGAARIVLGAESKNNFELGIKIIPVGITYSNPMNFRTDVQLNFGDPISVKDYQKAYEEDSFSAAKLLTKNIEKSIKEEMLLIENRENDEVFDQIQKLYFEEMINRFKIPSLTDSEKLELKNGLVKAIEYFKNSAPDFSNKLQQLLKEYFAKMSDIESKYPEFNARLVNGKSLLSTRFIALLIGFPMFLLGTIFNYIPYQSSGFLAEKYSQRDDFTGGLRLVIGAFLFLTTYIFWLIIFVQFFNILFALTLFFLIPFSGMFSLGYIRIFSALKSEIFYRRMIVTNNYSFKKLLELRSDIIEELDKARLLYNERTIN